MSKLKAFEKIMFFTNSIVAFLLLLSYVLPHLPPKQFAFISVLSLGVPFLIIINLIFFIYWLLKIKRQLLLSLLVLVIGYNYVFSFYKFSSSKTVNDKENISIMNYNVRLFNLFEWIGDKDTKLHISEFISENNPDILCIQEYRREASFLMEGYHKHEVLRGEKIKNGQAIFSKFPIVNSGSIDFQGTYNNAIFVDIVKNNDTLRIYNLHLQSAGIDSRVEKLADEKSGNLMNRMSKTFKMQQTQAAKFLSHRKECHYPTVVSGDFNNTAYSYVYRKIKGDDLKDAFVKAGNGFGRTFDFKFFPIRIDFVMVDNDFEVNGFKTYDVKFSDHYPIMAQVRLK
ncbi:MAG: endonuclease/exonuclease/phosphatase family protein [Bacteroidota bacterium]